MYKTSLITFLLFLMFPATTQAKSYAVDDQQSAVSFSGEHAGTAFKGVFEDWNADIAFNKDDLQNSKVTVIFNTISAKTGNAMYDGTLPTTDWFNSNAYPEAVFESALFSQTETGFNVQGNLTIKNISHPFAFDFTLSDSPVTMKASFAIDRLLFDIGKNSDPEAEWVNRDIMIDIHLVAE